MFRARVAFIFPVFSLFFFFCTKRSVKGIVCEDVWVVMLNGFRWVFSTGKRGVFCLFREARGRKKGSF